MKLYPAPTTVKDYLTVSEFERVSAFFLEVEWKFGWRSNLAGECILHWNKHFAGGGKSSMTSCDLELMEHADFGAISTVWNTLKTSLLTGHTLVRCYGNAHTFGLEGGLHRDNPQEIEMTTTILYVHRQWPVPWGGELVLYSENCEDVDATIIPLPNLLVSFEGSQRHVAKSPSRLCAQLRMSLIFKSRKQ